MDACGRLKTQLTAQLYYWTFWQKYWITVCTVCSTKFQYSLTCNFLCFCFYWKSKAWQPSAIFNTSWTRRSLLLRWDNFLNGRETGIELRVSQMSFWLLPFSNIWACYSMRVRGEASDVCLWGITASQHQAFTLKLAQPKTSFMTLSDYPCLHACVPLSSKSLVFCCR